MYKRIIVIWRVDSRKDEPELRKRFERGIYSLRVLLSPGQLGFESDIYSLTVVMASMAKACLFAAISRFWVLVNFMIGPISSGEELPFLDFRLQFSLSEDRKRKNKNFIALVIDCNTLFLVELVFFLSQTVDASVP